MTNFSPDFSRLVSVSESTHSPIFDHPFVVDGSLVANATITPLSSTILLNVGGLRLMPSLLLHRSLVSRKLKAIKEKSVQMVERLGAKGRSLFTDDSAEQEATAHFCHLELFTEYITMSSLDQSSSLGGVTSLSIDLVDIAEAGLVENDNRYFYIAINQTPTDSHFNFTNHFPSRPTPVRFHVFRILPPCLLTHSAHSSIASLFSIDCRRDPTTSDCSSFPRHSIRLVKSLVDLLRRRRQPKIDVESTANQYSALATTTSSTNRLHFATAPESGSGSRPAPLEAIEEQGGAGFRSRHLITSASVMRPPLIHRQLDVATSLHNQSLNPALLGRISIAPLQSTCIQGLEVPPKSSNRFIRSVSKAASSWRDFLGGGGTARRSTRSNQHLITSSPTTTSRSHPTASTAANRIRASFRSSAFCSSKNSANHHPQPSTPVLRQRQQVLSPPCKRPTVTVKLGGTGRHRRRQADVNQSDVPLSDPIKWASDFDFMLKQKDALVAFRKFMVERYCDENLDFWQTAVSWRDNYPGDDNVRLCPPPPPHIYRDCRNEKKRSRTSNMATSAGFTHSRAKVNPPMKGSFPLDRTGQCKQFMRDWLACIKRTPDQSSSACRLEAIGYLRCRSDHNLMAPEEPALLGFTAEEWQEADDRRTGDGGNKA